MTGALAKADKQKRQRQIKELLVWTKSCLSDSGNCETRGTALLLWKGVRCRLASSQLLHAEIICRGPRVRLAWHLLSLSMASTMVNLV